MVGVPENEKTGPEEGHFRAKQQTLTHKRGKHTRADLKRTQEATTKLPRPEGAASDAGTAARELHAPENAQGRSGA